MLNDREITNKVNEKRFKLHTRDAVLAFDFSWDKVLVRYTRWIEIAKMDIECKACIQRQEDAESQLANTASHEIQELESQIYHWKSMYQDCNGGF